MSFTCLNIIFYYGLTKLLNCLSDEYIQNYYVETPAHLYANLWLPLTLHSLDSYQALLPPPAAWGLHRRPGIFVYSQIPSIIISKFILFPLLALQPLATQCFPNLPTLDRPRLSLFSSLFMILVWHLRCSLSTYSFLPLQAILAKFHLSSRDKIVDLALCRTSIQARASPKRSPKPQ